MLTLTQQLFGGQDPDMQRAELSPEVIADVRADFCAYFTELSHERRAEPSDDLATLIANGTIEGEPMPELAAMGYYVIVATAVHGVVQRSSASSA